MINYLEEWKRHLFSRKSLVLREPIEVEGKRDKHLGPRMEYARVVFRIEPAAFFEVDFSSFKNSLDDIQKRMIDEAIFGLLDIALTANAQPLKNIRIVLVDAEFDPINSSLIAFRYAGIDAGKKVLNSLSQGDMPAS